VTHLLLDNSAWARLDSPALPQDRAEEIADLIANGNIAVSLPFLIEAGYSARDATDYNDLLDDLQRLDRYALSRATEDRALDAQRQLAEHGHHRLPPVDLLLAALADAYGLGILHYDADFDHILDHTDLTFDSVWLTRRGDL
jgi:predicted nucleic acid-binding protein